jgi:hypothetical protein
MRVLGYAFSLAVMASGAALAVPADSVDTVDKIAVVVGDEVILASELANQIQMVAFQTGTRPEGAKQIAEFQKQVLEQMVSDKLFLMEAKEDTTIEVRPEEVQEALDEHIAKVIENFGSEDAFLQALAGEGMTLRDLQRQYEQEIQNNLLRQRYIQRKLYSVSVSKFEVLHRFPGLDPGPAGGRQTGACPPRHQAVAGDRRFRSRTGRTAPSAHSRRRRFRLYFRAVLEHGGGRQRR